VTVLYKLIKNVKRDNSRFGKVINGTGPLFPAQNCIFLFSA